MNRHPGEPPWGQHAPVVRPPFTFGRNLRFRASPCARAGPKAAAVKVEGVGLSGELDIVQHTVVLLQDSRHADRGIALHPRPT